MVGTLLDVADDQHREHPFPGELRSLHVQGLQTRLGIFGRIIGAEIRDRVSAIAIGSGAALSAWAIFYSIVDAGGEARFYQIYGNGPISTFGPFTSLGIILYVLWIIAAITAVIGMPRLTRILLVATFPVAVIARLLSERLGMSLFPSTTTVLVLEILATLALLGTARANTRRRVWIAASLTVGASLLTYALWSGHMLPSTGRYFFFERAFFLINWPPMVAWITAGASIIVVACLATRRWVWASVTAISVLPWLALYVYRNQDGILFWGLCMLVLASVATAVSLLTAGYRINVTKV